MKIGITGGMGSGKSFISSIFEALDIPIYNADIRAKFLMQSDLRLRKDIINMFGPDAYRLQELNRPYLAAKVFSNAQALQGLNSLVHPRVKEDFTHWSETIKNQNFGIESAILFESQFETLADKIILVTAPFEVRLQRIIQRDHITEAEIRNRMQTQWTDEQKISKAHHIIMNDGKCALLPQIEQIISTLD